MSKKQRIKNRKCSALLAIGAGAAVCLTGGSPAHAVTGAVAASNGTSFFGPTTGTPSTSTTFNLMGSKISCRLSSVASLFGTLLLGPGTGTDFHTNSAQRVVQHPAGVGVSSLTPWFPAFVIIDAPASDVYWAIRFEDSGTKYGWVHVISTSNSQRRIRIDLWSYNGGGGNINTLSDSVSTSRLALTDGQEKLHWSNDNEDGVARYEVQSQDASGEWQAADSDVPGSGSYSAKVDSGKTCRLVVEMTDGSTKEIAF